MKRKQFFNDFIQIKNKEFQTFSLDFLLEKLPPTVPPFLAPVDFI
jgi:hypothetical protein